MYCYRPIPTYVSMDYSICNLVGMIFSPLTPNTVLYGLTSSVIYEKWLTSIASSRDIRMPSFSSNTCIDMERAYWNHSFASSQLRYL